MFLPASARRRAIWCRQKIISKIPKSKDGVKCCVPIQEIMIQVLRDKIGTAMTNIKSRTDHTYMVRKGRGRRRSDPSRKRVQMYV